MLSAWEMASRWVSALRLCRRGLLRSRSTDMACLLETLACTQPSSLSDASKPYGTSFRQPPTQHPLKLQLFASSMQRFAPELAQAQSTRIIFPFSLGEDLACPLQSVKANL